MSRFLIDRFQGMEGYQLGEQPKDREYIKLNANESPFPPSPLVLASVTGELQRAQRLYPDPACTEIRREVARLYGLPMERIFCDAGSDVILGYAIQAFGGGGRPVCFPDVTYNFYKVCCRTFGVPFHEVPLREDFQLAVEDYRGHRGCVFIPNPNAPTGLTLTLEQIERLLAQDRDRLVLIDEAYVDYGNESCIPLTVQYDNLLVVHTLSKAYSLAGARVGFAVGSEAVIKDLNALKDSFNPDSISTLSHAAGAAALRDQAYMRRCVGVVMETRDWLKEELRALGFTLTDSHTSFLLASPKGISAPEYAKKLRERGILIRYYPQPRIDGYVRISIGSREQMEHFLQATKEILAAL